MSGAEGLAHCARAWMVDDLPDHPPKVAIDRSAGFFEL
jgi:hypothetical protein